MKIYRLARRAVPLFVLLALCLPAAFPAAAGAEVQTIDFDTGTLGSPLEGQGDVGFPLSQGFRPYRTDVGIRAHSGTTVGDVGRCAQEVEARGGDAGACEFFQAATTAVLARTARSVTLFAGRFGPVEPLDPPEQATLTAFDANGTRLASTGPVPIGTGFNTPLSVSNDAGRIARFTVRATSGPFGENEFAGDLGIDDLSVNFADGGAPDFSVSAPAQILALVQGQSLQVPVQINRVNGSNGSVFLSVSDLPAGVSASPVTVSGTGTTATITLSADPSAPDTAFVPTDATITADPLGNANVGPGPREAPLKVRVARDFELSVKGFSEADLLLSGGRIQIEAPDCAPLDVPVKVTRDIAFDRDVALRLAYEVQGLEAPLPQGIGAEIVPGAVVPPGGTLAAERTLRLSAARNLLPPVLDLVFKAEANRGGSARALPLELIRRTPQASISPGGLGSGYGRTPRLGRPGTRVRIHGTGFCPGTKVEVGNDQATAPATLIDPHTIEFTVPRYATTGPVTIVPPGRASLKYESDDTLTVDSFRNSAGFAFKNFNWGALSLSELTTAFGADDLFIKINPCWPFGDCTVRTGFLSPLAAIEWGMLNGILQAPGSAHCYGMALAARRFTDGREPYRTYADPGRGKASSVFELSDPLGPGDRLHSLLDAEHVKQYSEEFISAWVSRKRPVQTQLDFLKREFERGHTVELSLKGSRTRGHVVLAYDLEQTRDKATIYTYDSAVPFEPPEDRSGSTHRSLVDFSNVTVDKASRSWTMPGLYTGGWYGTLWAIPPDTVPEDPSLPGVGTLAKAVTEFVLGSSDGAVEVTRTSSGAEPLPLSDGTASSSTGGTWVSDDLEQPLEVSLLGRKSGSFSHSYVAPGFAARVADLSTDEGVRDTITGSGDSLRVESGEARALQVDLARRAGGSAAAGASLETHASADGADSAGLSEDGTLTYAHDGAPTTAEFTLTAVRRDGGPAKFVSGAVPVGRGDHLRAEPLDRELRRVRLTIRDARGRTTTRVLRDRSRPAVRLRLGAPSVRGHHLAMRIRARAASARAMVGVSMRVIRAGRLVARRAIALKGVAGSRQVHWRLPRSLRDGRYQLLVDARAISVAGRGSPISDGTSARRAAGISVGL
jgi:hypothetical protein